MIVAEYVKDAVYDEPSQLLAYAHAIRAGVAPSDFGSDVDVASWHAA
jgi:hypothetical protein